MNTFTTPVTKISMLLIDYPIKLNKKRVPKHFLQLLSSKINKIQKANLKKRKASTELERVGGS